MSGTERSAHGPAQVLEAWVEAFNRSDLEAICALYEAEALLWGTSATALTCGAVGIGAYFRTVFSVQPQPQMQVTASVAHEHGDSAVLAGSYELKMIAHGRWQSVPARFLFALHRSAVGWRIVAHHSSKVPTEPLVPEAGVAGGA